GAQRAGRGDAVQHLPDAVGTATHIGPPGQHARHEVNVETGTRLAGIVGERAEVATYHHQALDRLGTGLVGCAWAGDGVIEAVEVPGRTWALGVQWHPEAHEGAALFAAFAQACA